MNVSYGLELWCWHQFIASSFFVSCWWDDHRWFKIHLSRWVSKIKGCLHTICMLRQWEILQSTDTLAELGGTCTSGQRTHCCCLNWWGGGGGGGMQPEFCTTWKQFTTHTYTQRNTHVRSQTYIHALTNIHTYANTLTHTHTHTHTHTYIHSHPRQHNSHTVFGMMTFYLSLQSEQHGSIIARWELGWQQCYDC